MSLLLCRELCKLYTCVCVFVRQRGLMNSPSSPVPRWVMISGYRGRLLSPLIPHMINEGSNATRVIAATFHAQLEAMEQISVYLHNNQIFYKFISDDLVILFFNPFSH